MISLGDFAVFFPSLFDSPSPLSFHANICSYHNIEFQCYPLSFKVVHVDLAAI